jgi:hypothetical protein
MQEPRRWYWHIDIDTTKAALERLGRAIVLTYAGIPCGKLTRMPVRYPLGRGVSALLVVELPEGDEQVFRELVKPIAMAPPPRVSVGMDRPKPDGHPGREPGWKVEG